MVKNRIYLIYFIYVSLSSSPLFPYWIFNHTKRVMYAISMFAIGSFPHLEQPSVLVVQTVHRLQSTSLLHLPSFARTFINPRKSLVYSFRSKRYRHTLSCQ